MNTNTLALGQEVYMVSGIYSRKGRVVKIASDGAEVQAYPSTAWGAETWRFDRNGKERDGHDTVECGPWYLEKGEQPANKPT